MLRFYFNITQARIYVLTRFKLVPMPSDLKSYIRDIADFPQPGIIFKDITPLLANPQALNQASENLFALTLGKKINKVAAIEARGFIFGSILAKMLNVGMVPIRKPGKLPAATIKTSYSLEYGSNDLEIHKDAISQGDLVLVHDDVLATGGTAKAACELIEKLGGTVVQLIFLIQLNFLNGKEKLSEYEARSVLSY